MRNVPGIVEGDAAAVVGGAEQQLMILSCRLRSLIPLLVFSPFTPKPPSFRRWCFDVSLTPKLVAVVGGQPLQSRAGNDRHAVGMVQSDAGFQHVLRPETDD